MTTAIHPFRVFSVSRIIDSFQTRRSRRAWLGRSSSSVLLIRRKLARISPLKTARRLSAVRITILTPDTDARGNQLCYHIHMDLEKPRLIRRPPFLQCGFTAMNCSHD
jgi:hypothetical protein